MDTRCTVVIATYNRRARLSETLARIASLGETHPVIVVDNGSSDGTVRYVTERHPAVRIVSLPQNRGAAARNVGAELATTPFVAFCDDDTWWEAGSIARGARRLAAYPSVALLNGCIVVDGQRIDEVCHIMARSTVPNRSTCPGPAIVRFMACAAIVRRSAFLAIGGFHERYCIGAEETLVALDLMARGYELVYADDLILHHAPYPAARNPRERRVVVVRNRLWTIWLRLSPRTSIGATLALLWASVRDGEARDGLRRAVRGLGWIVRERRRVLPRVERRYRLALELPP